MRALSILIERARRQRNMNPFQPDFTVNIRHLRSEGEAAALSKSQFQVTARSRSVARCPGRWLGVPVLCPVSV